MKKIRVLFGLFIAVFSLSVSYASTTFEAKNNYPSDPNTCVKGQWYDDGNFAYLCKEPGVLCPTYCIVVNQDEGNYLALERNEKIIYDQEDTLRCEWNNKGVMEQVVESSGSASLVTSKPSSALCK